MIPHLSLRPLVEELEPRILFSADFAPALADAFAPQFEQRLIGMDGEFEAAANNLQPAQHARFEVVFIDLRVQDYEQIVADIQSQNTDGRSIEVVLLDSQRDGITQIGDFIGRYQNIGAIHIISHGSDGAIDLGSTQLNANSLLRNATTIQQWGRSLNSDADILIYGCDLAATSAGQSLVNVLAKLTGADVAASDDLTGNTALGGNYELEYATGTIEGKVALSHDAQQSWRYVLANLPPVAINDSGATTEDSILTVASPGVLANDSDPDSTPVSGATLNFNAANDNNGVWNNETALTDFDWTLTNFGTQSTHTTSPGSAYPGITAAYRFSGTNSGASMPSFEGIAGDPTNNSASFEIWFRTDTLSTASGQHIIFEAGGVNTGLSIYLDNTFVKFAVRTNGAAADEVSVNLAPMFPTPTAEFIQLVGVVDQTSNQMKLYINGTLHATKSFTGSNGTDWNGPDGAGLGRVFTDASSGPAAGSGNLGGDIAIFRFYEWALTAAEATTNFSAVAGSALTVSQVQGNAANVGNQFALASGALLTLNANGAYTYNPNGRFEYLGAGQSSTDSFSYTVADAGGATATATVAITINGANDAPTINSAVPVVLTGTDEDTPSSGTTANSILTSANWADVETGALKGIAITSQSGSGNWQYSTDGTTWTAFGSVSSTNALLIDSATQVRYVPNGINGETALFGFRAWDRTAGTASTNASPAFANPGSGGGSSAYSSESGTASMTVSSVNDAPTASNLNAPETYIEDTSLNLTDIVVSDVDSPTVTVTLTLSTLTAGSLNTGTSSGVTSTYNAGTGVWSASGAISDINTLLAALTFTPSPNFNSNFTIATRVSDGVAAPITGSKTMTGVAVNDAPTFVVGDGKIITAFSAGDDLGYDLTLQADGKVLVVGSAWNGSNDDFAVARYNTDGSLDTSFGIGGKVTTAIGAGRDWAHGVVEQADGKIVVAGRSSIGGDDDFALVRYNADGTLDASFGSGGIVTTAIGTANDVGNYVALQADGKIIVVGRSHNGSNFDFAIVRYNSDGSLDASFGGGGKVSTAIGSGDDIIQGVALQADGRIVVAGRSFNGSNFNFAVARYNSDGSLDASFGSGGKLTTAIGSANDQAASVAVQADGKIVVVGITTNAGNDDVAVVRYLADGSLDTGFGTGGKVTTAIGASADQGQRVALQTDGKIVIAGPSSNGSNFDFALVRYNSDGSLDASFGSGGKVSTAISPGTDVNFGLAIQTDGRIVTGAYASNGSDIDFALARFNNDGSLDTSFDTGILNGRPIFTEGGAAVVLDSDIQVFDAELSAANNFNGATLTLVRNGGANSEDLFSASNNLSALIEGGNLVLSGVTIGSVTSNSTGKLALTFNASATQTRVNETLQSIAYANSSDALPASATIDWSFNDGNAGAQGTGGAGITNGITIVTLIAVNDAPTNLSPGVRLNLDGGTNAYLVDSTSGAPYWQGFTGITMEFTISEMQTPAGMATLYSKQAAGSASYFAVHADGTLNWTGYTSTGKYTQLFDGGVHTLAFSWDAPAGSLRFYVDGTLVETRSTTPQAQTNGGGVFTLGQKQNTVGGGFIATQRFSGTFHDVRIWNHVRTSADIAQHNGYKLDMTAAQAASHGLVANWQMDSFVAGKIIDIAKGYALTVGNASGTGYTLSTPTDTPSVLENAANGTHVAYVAATDKDTGESHTFSLIDSAGGRFAISTSGKVTVANGLLLDYETASSHVITVRVVDSGGLAYDEAVTIRVIDVNEAPSVTNLNAAESYTEDTPLNLIDIVVSDVDSANVTVTLTLSNAAAGSLNTSTSGAVTSTYNAGTGVWSASGAIANINTLLAALTFTPAPNFNSNFTIATRVSDGSAPPISGTKSFTGTAVDDPAVIGGTTSYSGNEGDAVSGTLTATDVDGLTDSTYFSVTTPASFGLAAIDAATGAWTFTALDSNWFGSDSFTVTVTDDLGSTTTQLISITLANVDDPAVISGTTNYSGNESDAVSGTLTATDVDGLTDSTYFSVTTPTVFGSAMIDAATGAWTFTPFDANWFGSDSFTVTVTDDLGGTTTQLVTINLAAAEVTPIANDDAFTGDAGTSMTGNVLSNDTDANNDSLTAILVSNPANGTLTLNADGSFVYYPNAKFGGTDTFTYVTNDGLQNSNIATVTITVNPVPTDIAPPTDPVISPTADGPVIPPSDESTVSELLPAHEPDWATAQSDQAAWTGYSLSELATGNLFNEPLQTKATWLHDEALPARQVLTNPELKGDLILQLLKLIQADTLSNASQNRMGPAIHVDITPDESFQVEVITRGVQVTVATFSVGAVWWALRVGGLFASLMTSLPAWRSFDLLPVLNRDDDDPTEIPWDDNDDEINKGLNPAKPSQGGTS